MVEAASARRSSGPGCLACLPALRCGLLPARTFHPDPFSQEMPKVELEPTCCQQKDAQSCLSHCTSSSLPQSLSQELSSPDQTATWEPSTKSIEWVIPRLQGGSQLSALFKVRSMNSGEGRGMGQAIAALFLPTALLFFSWRCQG